MVKSEKIVKGKPLREYMQEYRQRPYVKAKQKEYQQRPDVKAKQKEYRQRHADELKAKKKEYYRRHADELKAKQRKYYQRHADELNAKQRVNKVGNVDNIRKICLEHNLSKEIATAIAMDGKMLDKKMKERGILSTTTD